jgi:hypothetical protein
MTESPKGSLVEMHTGSWCGDRPFHLAFPEGWKVTVAGADPPPAISADELASAIASPVGTRPLAELLTSAKSLAVLIDDHTRPTPVRDTLEEVIRIARSAGIPESRMKVVVALGTHVLDKRSLMREKVGDLYDSGIELVFPNAFDDRSLVRLGGGPDGYPLEVNRDFAEADVRVTISGTYPHDDVGFSGGAKILIGAFGLRTISALHRKHQPILRGSVVECDFRTALESLADTVGVDYSINLVLNQRKEVTAAVSGAFRPAFRQAVSIFQRSHGVALDGEIDVLISNAYPLDTSLSILGKSTWPFRVRPDVPFKILVTALCDCSDRRLPFSTTPTERRLNVLKRALFLNQGKKALRELMAGLRARRSTERMWDHGHVVYVPHLHGRQRRRSVVGGAPAYHSWSEVIAALRHGLPRGHVPHVVVLPCAPLLFPIPPDGDGARLSMADGGSP